MSDTHGYSDDDMVGIGVAAEITGFTPKTLRRWDSSGRLRVFRSPAGARRYRVGDLRTVLQPNDAGVEPAESSGAVA